MILEALTGYYEAKAARGEISPRGWSTVQVSYALVLNEAGELIDLMPLKQELLRGKKTVWRPTPMQVPEQIGRTVGISPNFLADNSSYLLGIDAKGKPARSRECFAASAARHKALLEHLDCPAARAICAYFAAWKPEDAAAHPVLAPYLEELFAASNLIFRVNGEFAQKDAVISAAWNAQSRAAEPDGICAVTGKRDHIAATHPPIRGVRGAQSSGASLVSYNTSALCSYGKTQSQNSSVGEEAAFAYTTALNALLADREHTRFMGDTTVLYWSESAEPQYEDLYQHFMDGGDTLQEQDLRGALKALSEARPYDLNGKTVLPEMKFYLLGLSPSAARLSVRFFYRNSFGEVAKNINQHYERLRMVRPPFVEKEMLSVWALLNETVNPKSTKKEASPVLAGAVLRAIIADQPYPAALFQQVMLRIRAEKKVTYGKAAIIKAYLLKKYEKEENKNKEAWNMQLNEDCDYLPYVLGRLFAILDRIQQEASGATTVKDKYFCSACATPAIIFPVLIKLESSHIKVLQRENKGLAITREKRLVKLTGMIHETYPTSLSLEDQGTFQLGYYHEMQKIFEPKAQEN